MILNTLMPKLGLFTRTKEVQIFCFEKPPVLLQVSIHSPKYIVFGDFALQTNEKYPDDNIEKLCEVFRVFPNGEKMYTHLPL